MVQLWLDTTVQKLFANDMEELPQLDPKTIFGKLCISWRDVGKYVMSR